MEEFGNYYIEPIETIGRGTFGIVQKVRVYNKSQTHYTEYARKIFSEHFIPLEYIEEYAKRFEIEVEEQSKCSHRNIVRICLHNLSGVKK